MTEGIISGVACALCIAVAVALQVTGDKFGSPWDILLAIASAPFILVAVVTWKMTFGFAKNKTDADGRRW